MDGQTTRQRLIKDLAEAIKIRHIKPNTREMNALVEGVARRSEDAWEYYLGASDRAYHMLVREAWNVNLR